MLAIGGGDNALACISDDLLVFRHRCLDAGIVHGLRESYALIIFASRLEGAACYCGGCIACDFVAADADADTGAAFKCADTEGTGVVAQLFPAIGQDADVAGTCQGTVRNASLHIIADLVDGHVAGDANVTGCGCADTGGGDIIVARGLHQGIRIGNLAAARNGSCRSLLDAVDADPGPAGEGTTAGCGDGNGIDGTLAVGCNGDVACCASLCSLDGRVLYFCRNVLVDQCGSCAALDGHFAGTAHAHTDGGQLGGVSRMERCLSCIGGRKGSVYHSGTGLLPGFACTGAAHIVIGYSAAQGDFPCYIYVAHHGQPGIAAGGFDVGIGNVRESRLFLSDGLAVCIFSFTDDGFCIAAAVVDGCRTAEAGALAGCYRSSDGIELACIGSGNVQVHARFRQVRHRTAGQVGLNLVGELVVGHRCADAGFASIGHGTGHVHFFGTAVRRNGQLICSNGGVADLGQNIVVLGLPGYTGGTAKALGTGGNAGCHVDA